jgi:DNA modification methylase
VERASTIVLDDDLLIEADNLAALRRLPTGRFDCVYIDPPFNTGRRQRRETIAVARDDAKGSRTGFGGRRYRAEVIRSLAFEDEEADYLGFLAPRLEEARRVLADHGTLYFHIDYREAHYCKVLLDEIFGRECFLNEIIWAYDYGGKPKGRWPAKHDTIFVYVKDLGAYHFDSEAVEREPYMAPGLVPPEKAARGKLPTDCYSADTDVLTARGWVPFSDLSPLDEVASVSADGDLVYAQPTKLHASEYRGPMRHLQSQSIDLLVTPNHSLFVRPKNGHDYGFVLAESLDNGPRYVSFLNRVAWHGRAAPAAIRVPPVDYGEKAYCAKPLPEFDPADWCEFVGWYLAEGSTVVYADRHETHIAQIKHPERVERVGRLLERLGLGAHYNGRSFVVCNKQLALYCRSLGKTSDKRIPRALLELPRPYLERLYEGLMLGDGYTRPRRGSHAPKESYVTTSPGLAADFQELVLKLGNTASVHRSQPPNGWSPRFTVSRRRSRESTIWPGRHVSKVEYDGTVHCCTVVPHHTLIVRRNGRPAVAGNCWWHTIVPTNGSEKTGYPTQKPEGVVRRMVQASSRPGGWCLDFFAGSGTLGAVCAKLDRRYVLVDSNPEAIAVARQRLA